MLIETDKLDAAGLAALSEPQVHQVYCGLDCAVTFEVLEALAGLCGVEAGELASEPDSSWPGTYNFERALQAPALDMMLRGFRIDEYERARAIRELELQCAELQRQIDLLAFAVWSKPLNPNSPKQLKEFFYSRMRLPEVIIREKGVAKVSTNREALEKLEVYFHARPLVALIEAWRDLSALLRQLKNEIDPDGRFRMSINIAGTETGRFSTSKSSTGTGGNGQNLKRDDDLEEGEFSVRSIFVSDPGWKLCNIDLEQTESRDVGLLQGSILQDWRYLDACEAGDLHVTVAKMVWPDLRAQEDLYNDASLLVCKKGTGWSDNPRISRAIADQPFYRHFSHRDMSKRGGHLTNYYGTAWTASRKLKVPLPIMENFREAYTERAFPAFPRWWRWTGERLQREGVLTTPYGRRRQFFGRTSDDATLREAIAFVPQSMTADRMNMGLWRVWKHMPEAQLLAQVHDSICFQYRETADEAAVVSKALELIQVPLTAPNGRVVLVRGEAKLGWNWGSGGASNPDGLVKWKSGVRDARVRSPQGLERLL
jgi:DNA polymerase I-like protein with 3'-5' exonuclease and polymerase domains